MDTLLTLAEVSVAMAGFSSIVVMFKRRESETWRKADADRFNGMILHSMLAVAFSFLPFTFTLLAVSESYSFQFCSGLLAIITGLQVVITSRLESSGALWIKTQVIVGGLTTAVLQALGAFGVFPEHGLGIYFLGVFWHLTQAGALFVMLIWIPGSMVAED